VIPVIGLLAGIALGLLLEPSVPAVLQPYLPIAIVAAMDALIGGLRAYLEGTFSDRVFVVSFVSNIIVAATIVYVGDQIGVGSRPPSWSSWVSGSTPTSPLSAGR
jgi:small basic protein